MLTLRAVVMKINYFLRIHYFLWFIIHTYVPACTYAHIRPYIHTFIHTYIRKTPCDFYVCNLTMCICYAVLTSY